MLTLVKFKLILAKPKLNCDELKLTSIKPKIDLNYLWLNLKQT
jgi:hypothetical protein